MAEPLPQGETLGDYTVGEVLGAGGMGTVHRGWRRSDRHPVALKVISGPVLRSRFETEARLLGSLDHPLVVPVLDSFTEEGISVIVMEHVDGRDLRRVIDEDGDPGLPVDVAVSHVVDAAGALDYLHEQLVVHRDVKPQNLVSSEAGTVLVDFGIAREVDPSAPETATGAIGTPGYMSPEVAAGEELTPRSDVFGLAATLWTLIVGTVPHYGQRERASELAPGVPAWIDECLEDGLQLRPEKRTASPRDLAERLDATVGPESGTSLAASSPLRGAPAELLESIVRTAAKVLDAAACSVALFDADGGEFVYRAAWGAGSREIVGRRLPSSEGIAGAVARERSPIIVPDCRSDPRFSVNTAEQTGYVPVSMIVVPMMRGGEVIGVLSVLDGRDGLPLGPAIADRATAFAELATDALGEGGF